MLHPRNPPDLETQIPRYKLRSFQKLRFCTARYREIWDSWFGGFQKFSKFGGNCYTLFPEVSRHCNALHCNALQHTATYCNTLQYTYCNTLQHTIRCFLKYRATLTKHTDYFVCTEQDRNTHTHTTKKKKMWVIPRPRIILDLSEWTL